VVPRLEQLGNLRRRAPPEAGKFYWIAFSNNGHPLKLGDRVNLVIGAFHAEGLAVD